MKTHYIKGTIGFWPVKVLTVHIYYVVRLDTH